MALKVLSLSLTLIWGVAVRVESGSALYDETICGSSRLRLHTIEELKDLEIMDSRYPDADVETDLTGDGLNEYLSAYGCGNATCNYAIYFQESEGQYRCVGEMSMHREGFIRVVDSKHHGFCDVLAYYRLGGQEGNLVRLQFDGGTYKIVHSLKGKSDDLYPFVQKVVGQ